MPDRPELVVASRNPGKLDEIRHILSDNPPLRSVADWPDVPEVEEDRDTFEGNAAKKAVEVARQTGLAAIADDSGLEVDHLKGAPGVYSARFAGPNASDEENNRLLLERMDDAADRSARFRCVIALSTPDGEVSTVSGSCEDVVTDAPRGSGGFGYDPLFLVPELGLTFAELSYEQKNRISHRGKALEAVRPLIREMFGTDPD